MQDKSIEELADNAISMGKKLTIGLTIPLFLFFLGMFTMPFGIIFWIIAILLFTTLFTQKNANSTGEENNEN